MWRTRELTLALCVGLTLSLVACGGETPEAGNEERPELAELGGKADVPSWLRHIPAEFNCTTAVRGRFTPWDSAHLYSFPGTQGTATTFAFEGTYAPSAGVGLAVYDAETGKRLASTRVRNANKATLAYTPEKEGKLLVAAYSLRAWTWGNYTLTASCAATSCASNDECAKGQFCAFKSGCGLDGTKGTCTVHPDACIALYKPVCGCDNRTHSNGCMAASAGVSVQHDGACLAIQVTGAVQKVGQPFPASLTNTSSETIYLGGCSAFDWQKQEGKTWVSTGPDRICVWEGLAQPVKPGTTFNQTMFPKAAGTYRLVGEYGLGCVADQPLSRAKCTSFRTAVSAHFTVAATCDFTADPSKSYVGKSKEECARIRFFCTADSTYFSDDCGCGCQKLVAPK
ncbi:MAG: hypothetical protein IT371_28365 [Deltaproteobacteria bacterium]|nr:hypothetical protein [Deltaproteobacteria bacterium]